MSTKAILIICIALLPCVARADIGTPLVWSTTFHLLIGNALLGLLEGVILAKAFKLSMVRCCLLLIFANYFSAWLGINFVPRLGAYWNPDIYNGLQITLVLIFVTYLLTLVMEWPFVALSFRHSQGWFRKSLVASLLIQTVSYVLLFGGYWLVSVGTLYTETTIVPAEQIAFPKGVQLFYISNADGNVYRKSSHGGETKIYDLKSSDSRSFLCIEGTHQGADLVVHLRRVGHPDKAIVILQDVIKLMPDAYWEMNRYWGWGRAAKIGTAIKSPWLFRWGHWESIGMWGENEKTQEQFRVAFDTPLGGWPLYRAIHLPEEKVLFQLGLDQLCLLDVTTRKLAIFARGHGPVAVTDEEMTQPIVKHKPD